MLAGTRQLTLNPNSGNSCFVVCGGAPCPTTLETSSFKSLVAAHGLRR